MRICGHFKQFENFTPYDLIASTWSLPSTEGPHPRQSLLEVTVAQSATLFALREYRASHIASRTRALRGTQGIQQTD
jgi:hypothetical protein